MRTAQNREQIKLQGGAIVLGIIILAIKFFAFYLTRSNAILVDALEAIINVAAGGFALFSIYLAAKPRDEDHPYGHGKVEFISAGFEGALIIMAGGGIIIKALYNLAYPTVVLGELDFGIALIFVSGALNYGLGVLLERKGDKTNSLTMKADGRHLKSDAYASAGLVIGLAAIYLTKIIWLDNVVAIVFGFVIIYSGIKIFRESLAGIMDETDTKLIENIISILNQHRADNHNWIDVHNMRVIKYGSAIHIDCDVTVPWYFNVRETHTEMENITGLVKANIKGEVELFIHPEPCLPTCCILCSKFECTLRQEAFKGSEEWTIENVSANRKHGFQ